VNIPSVPGELDTYIEPTQGRQSINYFTDISNIVFIDQQGNNTTAQNPNTGLLTVNLNSASQNPLNVILDVSVPAPGSGQPATSRTFNEVDIYFNDFYTTGLGYVTPGLQESFPNLVSATAFTGRVTAVQLYLNDGMFNWANISPNTAPVFLENQFLAQNENPATNLIQGFLSDYLSIDLTNVPKKPVMSNGQTANRLFVSGDDYALAKGTPTSAGVYFEVLTAFGVYPGLVYQSASSNGLPTKSYQLQEPNVLSVTNPGVVTSLEGLWYDFADRISATDSTLMITFPPTGDGSSQEFVLFNRTVSGGVNTFPNVYFGNLNYTASGGASFVAWPIADLEPASVANQISGTVKGFLNASGGSMTASGSNWWRLVHGGSFTVNKGTPTGIATTGRFVVYRV
jgi:hypothetical protein